MRFFFYIFLLFQLLYANNLNLKELLSEAQQFKVLEKRMDAEALSLEAKRHAQSSDAPLHLDSSIAYAKSFEQSGNEYEIGLSKEVKLGNTQALELSQAKLMHEAYLLDESKKLLALENSIKNEYHQYCLRRNYLDELQKSVQHFETLYTKKKRAYQYDEIAKVELLQLEMEQKRLQTQHNTLNEEVKNRQEQLLLLSNSPQSTHLSCTDLYSIQNISSLEPSLKISNQAYEKRLQSTQKGLQRHSKTLDQIDVSVGYLKELDRELYAVGVSIPLHFSSKKQEYERASLMHQSSALTLSHEVQQNHQKLASTKLSNRLNRLVTSISAYEKNIQHYQNELLPLIKKSYNYAQSSVLEYLVNQQQLISLHKELFEHQQSYYETLFQLYTLNEIKELP